MQSALELFNYGLILIYGTLLSFDFANLKFNVKIFRSEIVLMIILLILETLSWKFFGFETTRKIYPLIIHLIIIVFLSLYYKTTWIKAIVSVLTAYLCCQIPLWISLFVSLPFNNNKIFFNLCYTISILSILWLLKKYVVFPTAQLIDKSKKSLLVFGAIPLIYYIFDYLTTVYTNLFFTGALVVTEFLPAALSVLFFMFALLFYDELQKRSNTEKESILLSIQANQAKKELDALYEASEQAEIYRLNLRHHLALISGYLEDGNPEMAAEYIRQSNDIIDKITPSRYCQNTTVNLILSSFVSKAQSLGVIITIDANLPNDINFPVTELCTLLSNSLENAINAASFVEDILCKKVYFNCQMHKKQLMIYIENCYSGDVVIDDGLPKNRQSINGFGAKSMVMIIEKNNGYYSFNAQDGIFLLKIVLPLVA